VAGSGRGAAVFRSLALVALLLCYATILLGGNVMASDAGLACPDWPTCHGTFVPRLAGATGVEYAHRLGAFALTVTLALLGAAAVVVERSRPVLRNLALASLATVVPQALLGGAVVVSDLSVGVVLFHLGLATLLFGLLLVLVLLAHLREMPRRWVEWARRATEERPAAPETSQATHARRERVPSRARRPGVPAESAYAVVPGSSSSTSPP
jgi:cytochrome c oxidase assembly protein subunit 15